MQIDLIYIYKIIIQVKDFNKLEFSRNATSSKVYRLGSPKAKRHGRRLWDLNINTLSGYSELGSEVGELILRRLYHLQIGGCLARVLITNHSPGNY